MRVSSQRRLALLGGAIVIAIVGFVIAKPGDDKNDKQKTTAATTTLGGKTKSKPAAQAPPVAKLVVKGGKPVGGIKKVKVNKGDTIRLEVSSPDTSDEVHVHGYDFHKDLSPGHPVKFTFPAKLEGLFEAELESRKQQIYSIAVEP